MKYKKEILTRTDSQRLKVEYVIKHIESGTISPTDAIQVLKDSLRILKSVEDLIEAE